MSTLTTRLKLTKPDDAESADQSVFNADLDVVDKWVVPSCKLQMIATQNLAAAALAVTMTLDTIAYDTYSANPLGAMAQLGSNRIIIRTPGMYKISAHAAISYNASFTLGIRRLDLRRNGVTVVRDIRDGVLNAGQLTTLEVTTEEYLNANDLIDAGLTNNSGGTSTNGGGWPDAANISVLWVGEKP